MAKSIQHDPTALILELSAASTPSVHSPIAGSLLPDAIVSIPLVQNIRQVTDIAQPGDKVLSTSEMGDAVLAQLEEMP